MHRIIDNASQCFNTFPTIYLGKAKTNLLLDYQNKAKNQSEIQVTEAGWFWHWEDTYSHESTDPIALRIYRFRQPESLRQKRAAANCHQLIIASASQQGRRCRGGVKAGSSATHSPAALQK